MVRCEPQSLFLGSFLLSADKECQELEMATKTWGQTWQWWPRHPSASIQKNASSSCIDRKYLRASSVMALLHASSSSCFTFLLQALYSTYPCARHCCWHLTLMRSVTALLYKTALLWEQPIHKKFLCREIWHQGGNHVGSEQLYLGTTECDGSSRITRIQLHRGVEGIRKEWTCCLLG